MWLKKDFTEAEISKTDDFVDPSLKFLSVFDDFGFGLLYLLQLALAGIFFQNFVDLNQKLFKER